MAKTRIVGRVARVLAPAALALGVTGAHAAQPQPSNVTLAGDTPTWVSSATVTGATDPSTTVDFTVWLKLQNENKLQKQVQDLYAPGNANYHKFLNNSQFQATYSPSKGNVNAVTNYLTRNGFTIVSTAENNFYIHAEGTVAQIQQAFKVSVNNYNYHGKSLFANGSDPSVDYAMKGIISDITGIDNADGFQPAIVRATPNDPNGAPSSAWSGVCGNFNTSATLNVVDPTTGATVATPTYHGFVPCRGYGAAQLQKAYGVDQLIKSGIDGTGQTVAIVDAYGSPTILQDANQYSRDNGLPPLVLNQNFQIVSPPGITNKQESKAQDPLGWQAEVTLDVEAVHSLAPGAKIVLVAAPNNYADLDEAVNWVVIHHLANIVSNSWGLPFDLSAPGRASRDERIFMQAAAEGIGVSFSSGDCGDESISPSVDPQCGGTQSSDYPASSPWVTAVGGTSLFLNGDNSYNLETGWGHNTFTRLYLCQAYTTDANGVKTCTAYVSSQLELGFNGGAGGGLSYNFTAQPWQANAIGGATAAGFGPVSSNGVVHRAVPDVGMLADPYTGLNIEITDESIGATAPVSETYGGTSLACPLFSAVMALVDQQRATKGLAPAGLAAQYLYTLPAGALHDVTAPPAGIVNPLDDGQGFSLYYGSLNTGKFYDIAFNEDTHLAVGNGWDDVTGVGTPNAPGFVSALASAP